MSPLTAIRIMMLGPGSISPELFESRTEEMLRLLNNDPEEYAKRHRAQLILARMFGVGIWFILIVGVIMWLMNSIAFS